MSIETSASAHEQRFLDLVERNRGRVERLCRAFARSPTDLDDLRSEIWLQLWRALPSFDGRASEDTWLYRVGLNTVMLHGRREGLHRRASEAFEREPWWMTATTPAAGTERMERQRRLERLHRALRRLDPADRALVALYLEELPYRRIAEVTGLSESNVGVRLHRIRERLKRWLDEDETKTESTAKPAGPRRQR